MLVSQHLYLDVAGLGQELLEVHAVIAEGRMGFRTGGLQATNQLARVVHHPHAGGGLDQQRIARFAGEAHRVFLALEVACARKDGDPGGAHELSRL